jgi:hypothetical protein
MYTLTEKGHSERSEESISQVFQAGKADAPLLLTEPRSRRYIVPERFSERPEYTGR